jgi:hypothetical protein
MDVNEKQQLFALPLPILLVLRNRSLIRSNSNKEIGEYRTTGLTHKYCGTFQKAPMHCR